MDVKRGGAVPFASNGFVLFDYFDFLKLLWIT